MKLILTREGVRTNTGKHISMDEILPGFINETRDEDVKFEALVQMYKNGSLFTKIYPKFIESCPFCSLTFEAEIEIRLYEKTLKYCPFCGTNIDKIVEKWKNSVTVEVEK